MYISNYYTYTHSLSRLRLIDHVEKIELCRRLLFCRRLYLLRLCLALCKVEEFLLKRSEYWLIQIYTYDTHFQSIRIRTYKVINLCAVLEEHERRHL